MNDACLPTGRNSSNAKFILFLKHIIGLVLKIEHFMIFAVFIVSLLETSIKYDCRNAF